MSETKNIANEESNVIATTSTKPSTNTQDHPRNADHTDHHKNGYDFFGNSRRATVLKHKASSPAAQKPQDQGPIKTSFRASPLLAEFQKQQQQPTSTKILFLDEGGEFRAVLGAVLLKHMLSRLRTKLDVEVDWKSIGHPTEYNGPRERYILDIMESMSLDEDLIYNTHGSGHREDRISGGSAARSSYKQDRFTGPRKKFSDATASKRKFHEIEDSVKYDLILVMDRFDYQEVIKEVSILDTINPGGNYSAKIRLLGPYGINAKRATLARVKEDIGDPLYYLGGDMQTEHSELLQATAKDLAFACRGLATFLLNLHMNCWKSLKLRDALGQTLQCPLLTGVVHSHAPQRTAIHQFMNGAAVNSDPRNTETSSASSEISIAPPPHHRRDIILHNTNDDLFTIRAAKGERKVVRKRSRCYGYWSDLSNIERELRDWMRAHNIKDKLPSQRQLRISGASSLAASIDRHGGLRVFARRMGVSLSSRRPNGYWDEFHNVANALRPYLQRGTRALPHDVCHVDFDGVKVDIDDIHDTTVVGKEANSVHGKTSDADRIFLPTQRQLINCGRHDLIRAIRYHGGSSAVALKMGVGVRRGIAQSSEMHLQSMPTTPRYLDRAACKLREWLSEGETLQGPSSAAQLSSRSAPTRAELVAANREDLWNIVQKCGGMKRLAEHVGVSWRETKGRKKILDNDDDITGDIEYFNPSEEIDLLDAYEEFIFI